MFFFFKFAWFWFRNNVKIIEWRVQRIKSPGYQNQNLFEITQSSVWVFTNRTLTSVEDAIYVYARWRIKSTHKLFSHDFFLIVFVFLSIQFLQQPTRKNAIFTYKSTPPFLKFLYQTLIQISIYMYKCIHHRELVKPLAAAAFPLLYNNTTHTEMNSCSYSRQSWGSFQKCFFFLLSGSEEREFILALNKWYQWMSRIWCYKYLNYPDFSSENKLLKLRICWLVDIHNGAWYGDAWVLNRLPTHSADRFLSHRVPLLGKKVQNDSLTSSRFISRPGHNKDALDVVYHSFVRLTCNFETHFFISRSKEIYLLWKYSEFVDFV